MLMTQRLATLAMLAVALFATGCASVPQPAPYDYTAFKQSNPASILVLPPTHSTPNIRASDSVWAQVTFPLAESGFYVLPVTLVAESLRQNGVTLADEAHQIPLDKLREVFGADAVLYLNVTEYGTVYRVVASETSVSVQARLLDGLTGELLWEGAARASSAEQQNQEQGLVSMLITAAANQIISSVRDDSHPMAGLATRRLLSAGQGRSILFGPRSPNHHARVQASQGSGSR
jgi:hypothetical protein